MAMSYKALMISDIHMSNTLPYARPVEDGQTDRLLDQMKLWKHVSETAESEDVDGIYVLGDLFDKAKVDPVTMTATVRAITSLPRPVFLLAGNHDSNTTYGGRFMVEALGAMDHENITYIKTGDVLKPTEWLSFHPLSFASNAKSRAGLAEIKTRLVEDSQNVLLLHHSIVGCKHLGWVCDDGLVADEVVEGFDRVYTGHFHETQKFGEDGRGMYLGSPMHHEYGDNGRSAPYWIVTFREGKKTKHKMVEAPLPRFHYVHHPDGIPESARPGDYLRWVANATSEEWAVLQPIIQQEVEEARRLGYHASFKNKPRSSKVVRLARTDDVTKLPSLKQQIKAYVAHIRPDASPEERARYVARGLTILAEAHHAS
jgi:DNA repair exonuclease SbcCD nuclease subunit